MSTQLTDSELLAFCGLARMLVRLDHQFSHQERLALEELGPELSCPPPKLGIGSPYRSNPDEPDDGVDRFWALMDRSTTELADDQTLRGAALAVTRQFARQEIYLALYELAACDAICDPEWALLDWLSAQWDVHIDMSVEDSTEE
jgi:hypothetical protein